MFNLLIYIPLFWISNSSLIIFSKIALYVSYSLLHSLLLSRCLEMFEFLSVNRCLFTQIFGCTANIVRIISKQIHFVYYQGSVHLLKLTFNIKVLTLIYWKTNPRSIPLVYPVHSDVYLDLVSIISFCIYIWYNWYYWNETYQNPLINIEIDV